MRLSVRFSRYVPLNKHTITRTCDVDHMQILAGSSFFTLRLVTSLHHGSAIPKIGGGPYLCLALLLSEVKSPGRGL